MNWRILSWSITKFLKQTMKETYSSQKQKNTIKTLEIETLSFCWKRSCTLSFQEFQSKKMYLISFNFAKRTYMKILHRFNLSGQTDLIHRLKSYRATLQSVITVSYDSTACVESAREITLLVTNVSLITC